MSSLHVLVERDGARLGQLAGAYGAAHHTAELVAPQLRDVAARVGPVDHVVCATGVDARKGQDAHTDQEVELELAVDLAGPIHVARAFLPCLRPGGVIALFGGFGDGTLALPYEVADFVLAALLARETSRAPRWATPEPPSAAKQAKTIKIAAVSGNRSSSTGFSGGISDPRR
ncbi:hypothetical protein WMF30_37470 [Sorangium sp. So ce134]